MSEQRSSSNASAPAALDRGSGVPLYLQLASAVRHRIHNGALSTGGKVPRIEDLQREFGVARITVRQAMERLEREGLISRQKGKGTFVKSAGAERHWLRLTTEWEALLAQLRDNSPTQIPVEKTPPLPPLEQGVVPADSYVYLSSIQANESGNYAIVGVHLAKHIFDRDPARFRSRAILPTLADMKGVHVSRARQAILVGSADPDTASLLGVPLHTPIAEAHWLVLDEKKRAIYVGHVTYRGDCIKLMIDYL